MLLERRANPNASATTLGLVCIGISTTLLFAACARHSRAPAPPSRAEVGLASWYGLPHHGRKTASGETYNMEAMTAAHRTLPFGTRVRVRNLDNGASVEVRINDRGPVRRDRIIDLSRAAARRLGLLATGTVRVRIEVIEYPRRVASVTMCRGCMPTRGPAGARALWRNSCLERQRSRVPRTSV